MAAHSREHSHTLLHIVIVVLILIAAFAIVRHLMQKGKWNTYVVDSQKSVESYKNANSIEDAEMIASTIASVPNGSPLIKNGEALQTYILDLATMTGRDIVVVDTNKKILADAIPTNVGKQYTYDNGEILKTIGDSNPRTFLETSPDYPSGINQTVIAIKDGNGATVGALILSPSQIFSK